MAVSNRDAAEAPQTSVYTPVNILVTGGAGFIGSHVAKHLVMLHPECKVEKEHSFRLLSFFSGTT